MKGIEKDEKSFGVYVAPLDHECADHELENQLAETFINLPDKRTHYVDPEIPEDLMQEELKYAFKNVKFDNLVDVEFYGTYLYLCAMVSAFDVAEHVNMHYPRNSFVKKLIPRGGFEGCGVTKIRGDQMKNGEIRIYYPNMRDVAIGPLKPVKV